MNSINEDCTVLHYTTLIPLFNRTWKSFEQERWSTEKNHTTRRCSCLHWRHFRAATKS